MWLKVTFLYIKNEVELAGNMITESRFCRTPGILRIQRFPCRHFLIGQPSLGRKSVIQFISIISCGSRWQNRANARKFQAPDALEVIGYLPLFVEELIGIPDMLP